MSISVSRSRRGFGRACDGLLGRHPLVTKMVQAGLLMVVGDSASQRLLAPHQPQDWRRTASVGLFSVIWQAPGYGGVARAVITWLSAALKHVPTPGITSCCDCLTAGSFQLGSAGRHTK